MIITRAMYARLCSARDLLVSPGLPALGVEQRARRLLARGDLTVTEVCLELGFSSLGSFSALFSARTGESPLAYQRRVRRLWAVPGQLASRLDLGCFGLMCRLPPGAAAQFSRSAPGMKSLDERP